MVPNNYCYLFYFPWKRFSKSNGFEFHLSDVPFDMGSCRKWQKLVPNDNSSFYSLTLCKIIAILRAYIFIYYLRSPAKPTFHPRASALSCVSLILSRELLSYCLSLHIPYFEHIFHIACVDQFIIYFDSEFLFCVELDGMWRVHNCCLNVSNKQTNINTYT